MSSSLASVSTIWQQRLPELEAISQPLLRSCAVRRLERVTFLGILSPRFRDRVDSPLWLDASADPPDDGSRYSHTLGVALLALDLARRFEFSARGLLYAVAWGLTHDIATWPLSHTSEPAFASVTGVSARKLRTAILLGSGQVPERYRLSSTLHEMGVDPDILCRFFDRDAVMDEEELDLFNQVVRSPLTPDTLEGTWRGGLVFGVPVMEPGEMVAAFVRRGQLACLDRRRLVDALLFWQQKARIYRSCINREDVIRWESSWALGLERACPNLTLADSLELDEDDLVRMVLRNGLPPASVAVRYKEPQDYLIVDDLEALPAELPVSELWQVLRREPVGSRHE